jgi:hypothetical protein
MGVLASSVPVIGGEIRTVRYVSYPPRAGLILTFVNLKVLVFFRLP